MPLNFGFILACQLRKSSSMIQTKRIAAKVSPWRTPQKVRVFFSSKERVAPSCRSIRILAREGGHRFMRILKSRERETESKAFAMSTKIG